MASRKNYLLGQGERLTEVIEVALRPGEKRHPYTFDEARRRLAPMISACSASLDSLPRAACPANEAVVLATVHPSYLAKSYFPSKLLQAVGLRTLGSKAVTVKPARWATLNHPDTAVTAQLFLAGSRDAFRNWARALPKWSQSQRGADEPPRLEMVEAPTAEAKVKPFRSDGARPLMEIVLHASHSDTRILKFFGRYLESLGIEADFDERQVAGGLTFLPARVAREYVEHVARFSFVRVMREMPRLRTFAPVPAALRNVPGFPCSLPTSPALDPSVRAAIFDGGLPPQPDLSAWITPMELVGVKPPERTALRHGLGVSSALLFGSIEQDAVLPQPYCTVDHYRVIGGSEGDPEDLYPVLRRIVDSLESAHYDFVNISVGPDLPIEDDDVHAWTSVMDDHLSRAQTLATVAVGNTGQEDAASGNARVQPPADGVNVLAVGACDSMGPAWERASYSSIGPGRSPGIVKPDGVAFGGTSDEPFFVLQPGMVHATRPTQGTSFASPFALRTAIGVRAHLGPTLGPLALKALLIHSADSGEDRLQTGWGRFESDVEAIVALNDDEVRVVYQGELSPGSWLRAPIPVPASQMPGMVKLSATFCFATMTDPQDPIHYTRGGLEVLFRPDRNRRKDPTQRHPDTSPFFQAGTLYATELERRKDAHKWETTLHRSRLMRGTTLNDPAFDVHYHARERGGIARGPRPIPYALVVSVHARRVPNLYDLVRQRYRTVLRELVPVIQIPVRTGSARA